MNQDDLRPTCFPDSKIEKIVNCVPCSSIRGNISSEMVCKSNNMYDRVNKYTAKYLLIMDGQRIKKWPIVPAQHLTLSKIE